MFGTCNCLLCKEGSITHFACIGSALEIESTIHARLDSSLSVVRVSRTTFLVRDKVDDDDVKVLRPGIFLFSEKSQPFTIHFTPSRAASLRSEIGRNAGFPVEKPGLTYSNVFWVLTTY
jgi:hypothetical protein